MPAQAGNIEVHSITQLQADAEITYMLDTADQTGVLVTAVSYSPSESKLKVTIKGDSILTYMNAIKDNVQTNLSKDPEVFLHYS